jgi:AAA domain
MMRDPTWLGIDIEPDYEPVVRPATPPPTKPPPTTTKPQQKSPDVPAHWQRLDLAQLKIWPVAQLKAIIDGLIAWGNFVYVAAESQTGKSLFMIWLAWLLVQQGKDLFGHKITRVNRLLYLVLEDPARRVKARLDDMAHEFPDPLEPDRVIFQVAPGFTLIDDRWWKWLEAVITTERREVVFLDTYQKATPGLSSFADELQSKILHKLADLTRRLDVTLIVIDHVRKQSAGARRRSDLTLDDIKGTQGKAANADAVILIERTPTKKQIKFQAFSKDFDRPVRLLLDVAPKGSPGPKFTVAGDLDALGADASQRAPQRRAELLARLRALPPDAWTSAPDLATAVALSPNTVRQYLKDLVSLGAALDNGCAGRWRRYRATPIARSESSARKAIDESEAIS